MCGERAAAKCAAQRLPEIELDYGLEAGLGVRVGGHGRDARLLRRRELGAHAEGGGSGGALALGVGDHIAILHACSNPAIIGNHAKIIMYRNRTNGNKPITYGRGH